MDLPRLAVALDAPSLEPLEPVLDALHGLPVLAKIGLSLFCAVGPAVVHHVRSAGLPVFLDLKLHDIPHQVELAVEAVARLDVALLTVHASGGRQMLQAARKAARGRTRVIGVTVLTSLHEHDLAQTGDGGTIEAVVARRIELAREAGLDGVVCSPRELRLTQGMGPEFLRIVPGIRHAPAARDDQQRTATPREALEGGASVLVVGRPILASPDPRTAAQALLDQIAEHDAAAARRPRGWDHG